MGIICLVCDCESIIPESQACRADSSADYVDMTFDERCNARILCGVSG